MGEIEEIGENVENLSVGMRVSAEGHIAGSNSRNAKAGKLHLDPDTVNLGVDREGAFAEYLMMPASNVVALPESISNEVGSILDPFGNAVHATLSFDLVGEDVLITGAPVINTSSPTKSKDNVACTAFPNGSKILPTSLLIDSGNATTFEAGIIRYSANAPSLSTPKFTVSGSRCNLPALAFLLLDPAICPSADTLMPTLRFSTFSPISSISPINSWP